VHLHPAAISSLPADVAREMVCNARALLLDWDGCVALGRLPRPEALALMAQMQDRIAIVSNNSSNLPMEFAESLKTAGILLPPARIVLAGIEAITHAANLGARRVMVIGGRRMKAHARQLGMTMVDGDADCVLLLRDPHFSYAKLKRAANALRKGASLIVANGDLVHPGPRQQVVPETGALLAALLACVRDREVAYKVIGKPGPLLFERACVELGIAPSDALMLGDNPDTDIAGARALGMAALHIEGESALRFGDLMPPGVRSA
jgi:4-nitrophenyl phosphatase